MINVLIIDDEAMITQTLSTLIEMMLNYNVFTFNDSDDILNTGFLDEHKIDLVISDFMMPKRNGIEVLSAIKEKQPQVVPILLTGYSDKENAIKSINEVGLYYYLEKPWDNNQLITVIKNGVEKKLLEDKVEEKMIIIEKRNEEISRLYDLLKKDFNKEMGNVINVVIAMANLIEAKDACTDDHTRRVSNLCVKIGEKMEMSEEDIRYLEISAIIHDIGKVGTPESILNKPGKLSTDEFMTMKMHPELGAKILKPLAALERCVEPVLHHHEKLDGSGYPDGLTGDKINMETRIVGVADIFDALYSVRPYKAKFPIEKVMEIMHDEVKRNKIDGRVVNVIQELVDNDELSAIYD